MPDPDQPDTPSTLIAELAAWNDGEGVDAEDWIGMVGNYDLAIGYSQVFWPQFVRFEDYVFRRDFGTEAVRNWERPLKGNRSAVEAMLNHVHISDIHCNIMEVSEAQLRYLGRTLKAIYEVKLRADFPDLDFAVDFNDEPDLDLVDYQITFYQRRD
jgi:hypothetical protein